MLLLKIRGKTISYASHKKKVEKENEEKLIDVIRKLETNTDENAVLHIEDLKLQLQKIRNKKIEGMMVRSRVKWMQEGKNVVDIFVI